MADFPVAFEMLAPGNSEDCTVIYEYGTNSTAINTDVNDMLSSLPSAFRTFCTKIKADDHLTPYFRKSSYDTVDKMGDEIGKNIVSLNKLPINQVTSSQILGDGYILFEKVDKDNLKAHLSINNIIMPSYHRQNGITAIIPTNYTKIFPIPTPHAKLYQTNNINPTYQRRNRILLKEKDLIMTKNSFKNSILGSPTKATDTSRKVVGTEGMVGLMNLMTNAHLNKYYNPEIKDENGKRIYVTT